MTAHDAPAPVWVLPLYHATDRRLRRGLYGWVRLTYDDVCGLLRCLGPVEGQVDEEAIALPRSPWTGAHVGLRPLPAGFWDCNAQERLRAFRDALRRARGSGCAFTVAGDFDLPESEASGGVRASALDVVDGGDRVFWTIDVETTDEPAETGWLLRETLLLARLWTAPNPVALRAAFRAWARRDPSGALTALLGGLKPDVGVHPVVDVGSRLRDDDLVPLLEAGDPNVRGQALEMLGRRRG